jgi:hypothetical protein
MACGRCKDLLDEIEFMEHEITVAKETAHYWHKRYKDVEREYIELCHIEKEERG